MRIGLRLLELVFGKITWNPPVWWRGFGRAVTSYRRLAAALVALLVAVALGGLWADHYYRLLPKPRLVTLSALPISVTPLQEKLIPPPLTLRFSSSAAPLEALGKPVEKGVRITPPVPGVWRWERDRALVFRPEADWPAAASYHVALERNAVAPGVQLDCYALDVATPEFAAEFRKLEFYQDPTDPARKQVVATFEFTHSVDPAALQKNLALEMLGGSPVWKEGNPAFAVKGGLHNRVAYLTTEPLQLPEKEDFMKVALRKELTTVQGGARLEAGIEKKVRIPDLSRFFRVERTKGEIVRANDGTPEQFVMVETSAAAESAEIAKGLQIFLLPKKQAAAGTDKDEDSEDKDYRSPREADAEALGHAEPVPFTLIPSKEELSKLHTFKIHVEQDGELYVKIRKGTLAQGGFPMGSDYDQVLRVPQPRAEIEIQGSGGLLALSGEKKLSIRSRGVSAVRYEIGRVPADQINHLVSQTDGDFQHPEFYYPRSNDDDPGFNEDDIARFAYEVVPLHSESRFKANYATVDLGKHLVAEDGSPAQGLFFVNALSWDQKKNESMGDARTSRFVLVTDIGMLLKRNADSSRDVYLQSISGRKPLAGAAVEILARNGVALVSGTSDAGGKVAFPALSPVPKGEGEKEPVAVVARNGADVAFLPLERKNRQENDRQLDFSRFDIGGVESVSGKELDAFVFTERGIYRPGDVLHAGFIVKQRDWAGSLAGLPLETEVRDARGLPVQVQKIALPASGFAELSYQSAYESPSGDYALNIYLVRDGKRSRLLGSAHALVKEFLPDRMKIASSLLQSEKPLDASAAGWIDPKAVQSAVTLRNLYGTPATDRRVTGRLVLSPARFQFSQYKDYTFYDRLVDREKRVRFHDVELGDQQTGETGEARFDLGLERFADATYAMTFFAEGFEAEGGRSVAARSSALVSPLPYVVGSKADADLSCLEMGGKHALDFIAVDRALKKIALPHVTLDLFEQTDVAVLTKQDDGTYAYESVRKTKLLRSEAAPITENGFSYPLPTEKPGRYRLELRDKDSGARLGSADFRVLGRGGEASVPDKNAELDVQLASKQYNAGDDIAVNITAPYTGSGLITIERDKVYAAQWFQADTPGSVQHIRVPEGFEGTGYLNVSFIRGLDSKEIFTSPLSCGIVPITVNREKRRLQIDLNAAALVKPGEPLRLRYKTDRPAKIVIYAVDEGILQVTGYQLPDPLAHFFRKAALMVSTSQIVDLLLPEYSLLRSAAFGGGDDPGRLNPFKRVTEKPVVFWSGVIDADATEREAVYDVPDYFNGTLKVMAVAYAADTAEGPQNSKAGTASVEKETLVRGPFVLTPGVPVLAAPGDTFEAGVTVANNVAGSGSDARVTLQVEPSEHLEIVQAPAEPLLIPEGREVSVVLTVRVKEALGSASLLFTATDGKESAHLRSTLSVRPPVPLMTQVLSGNFTRPDTEVAVDRAMYPQFRRLDAVVSGVPLGLAHGLDAYLKNYPNGCSEQITSGAFCRLMVGDEADFALSRAEVFAQMQKTFATLRRRQNDQGAFGYWAAGESRGIDFLSVYVMHFLSEAREAGFAPPEDVFQSGLKNLQKMVVLEPRGLCEARTLAYAIYLLTREGVVTTNYILNLRDTLDKRQRGLWQNDLTGVYLAASLALLKDDAKAQELIGAYRMGAQNGRDFRRWDAFYQPFGADAQYVAILARHFPDRLKTLTAEQFRAILEPIGEGRFNTLTAAYAVVALKSYSRHLAANPSVLGVTEIGAANGKKTETPLKTTGGLVRRVPFSGNAQALRFSATPPVKGLGAFYQVVETGFDLRLPEKPVRDGLEIYRDLVDSHGRPVNATDRPARLGEPVTVRVRLRSLNGQTIPNVAILDLLPGGFEIVSTSLRPGVRSAGCDYVDVREDRAVLFTSAGPGVRTITYQIKPCNRGEFTIPPVFAESMYDRTLKARGLGGSIRVVEPK
ncbi:MAG: alpha-2-macroglobulin [Chthoniobacteraceae bacterium]|nr:alpha-2-macroglobulin [Chthoniobacteraceae bacterium]